MGLKLGRLTREPTRDLNDINVAVVSCRKMHRIELCRPLYFQLKLPDL